MLGSKKITAITGVLTAAALLFVIYFLINPPQSQNASGTVTYENGQTVEYTSSDYYSDYGAHESIASDGGDINITSSGVYEISGTFSGKSITVDAPGGGVVRLVLNGADITSDGSPAIYIKEASKTVISLAEGSTNTLTDTTEYNSDEYDSVIYSKDDIVINGTGTLNINANHADGVKTNDSLKIIEGNISVNAADEGICANDYIVLCGGVVSITSGGDGIKCENSDDASLGFIALEGGSLDIASGADAVWAGSDIYVNNTTAKISAADDAVHAEHTLFLNGGITDITSCTEGLEGAYIYINDGVYNVISTDDAFNATGESTLGGMGMGMRRGGMAAEVYLTVNGGEIHAQTGGDGLDSNAAAVINGGYVEVYGPENNGNSTLDFDGGFVINGGTVIAAGSSDMAESPTDQSGQNVITATLSQSYDAGTTFSITDESGNEIISAASAKKFDWLCVSSPEIKTNSIYTVTVGGNTEAEVLISSAVTKIGSRQNQIIPRGET